MPKEKFLVLDVEGLRGKRPYNIGYIVADRYGHIYQRRSIAIPGAFWENYLECLRIDQAVSMTKHNIYDILRDSEKPRRERKYRYMSPREFSKMLACDVDTYNVKRAFAYNVNFDKSMILNLIGADAFDRLGVQWCDIISGILTTKLLTLRYVKYCYEHGYLTETGFPSYRAEIVYRYLTGKLDFEEEHTGLADVLIEYEILLSAFKTHKKLDFKPTNAWARIRKFVKEKCGA